MRDYAISLASIPYGEFSLKALCLVSSGQKEAAVFSNMVAAHFNIPEKRSLVCVSIDDSAGHSNVGIHFDQRVGSIEVNDVESITAIGLREGFHTIGSLLVISAIGIHSPSLVPPKDFYLVVSQVKHNNIPIRSAEIIQMNWRDLIENF